MSTPVEQVPGFLFFDHVAISVRPGELEAHVKAYQAMGFRELHREEVRGGDQVREVLLQVGDGPNLVQLLEPLNADSPVAKLIEKNGGRGGLAHVALRVLDIQKAFDYLRENGFKIIDKAPRKGSRRTMVFFVHPKTTESAAFGYLLEVVQEGSHV
jgi:methylmalonyl-CoA/ethylmalonyl-CoA epimerase